MLSILFPARSRSGTIDDSEGIPTQSNSNSNNNSTTTNSAPAKPTKAKTVWCQSQWSNLSLQAKNLGLSPIPYFDPATGLLSKEVNHKMWKQIQKLYDALGADQAPFASPIMLEGGEVEWHSFLGKDKGDVVEIYNKKDKTMDW